MSETVTKWTRILRAIVANRLSHTVMMRKVIEHTIYLHNPEILRLMSEQQTHSPAFKEILLQTMKETIVHCEKTIAQMDINEEDC